MLVVSLAASAEAQTDIVPAPLGEPSAEELSRARGRFAEGTQAAEAGRWSDALGAFREAYELSGIVAALYNVGTTYRSLGQHAQARRAFDQLLRTHPELSEDMRTSVQELRDEVAARVATLELRGVPDDGELSLRLDGRQLEITPPRPIVLETEAGRHTVRLTLPAHEPFLWEGPVGEGDTQVLDVAFVALPETREGGMSTVGKIVLIGVLALVVAGAAVTTALLVGGDELEPKTPWVVNL